MKSVIIKWKPSKQSVNATNSFFYGLILGIVLILCHKYKNIYILKQIANYTQFLDIWWIIVIYFSIQKNSAKKIFTYTFIFFITFVLSFYIFQYILTKKIDSSHIIIFWFIASILCSIYTYIIKKADKYKSISSLLLSIPVGLIIANIIFIMGNSPSVIYLLISVLSCTAVIRMIIRNYKINYHIWLVSMILITVLYVLYIGKPLTHFI